MPIPFLRFIRKTVIYLSRFQPLRLLFLLYYRLAVFALKLYCRLGLPEIDSVLLHRGLAAGECSPGLSDIDSFIILREMRPEAEKIFLSRFYRAYSGLKRFFPVLGETQLVTETELGLYLAAGDIRSLNFEKGARTAFARKSRPETAKPALKHSTRKLFLDALTEGLHAHLRICRATLEPDRRFPGAAAHTLTKALLDVFRSCGMAEETAAGRPAKLPTRKEALSSLNGEEMKALIAAGNAQSAAVLAMSLRRMETAAQAGSALFSGRAACPGASCFPASVKETAIKKEFFDSLRRKLGGAAIAALFDSVYENWIILDAGITPAQTLETIAFLTAAKSSSDETFNGTLMLLMPHCAATAFSGAFREDPVFVPPFGGRETEICASAASGPVSGHWKAYWNPGEFMPFNRDEALTEELALESFTHFIRDWRMLCSPEARDPVFQRFNHLLSRSASSELYFLHGKSIACFPFQTLSQAYLEANPSAEHIFTMFRSGEYGLLREAVIPFVSASISRTLRGAAVAASALMTDCL
ncbi:MAG: hypothetical protein ABIG11_02360 [bacterium]